MAQSKQQGAVEERKGINEWNTFACLVHFDSMSMKTCLTYDQN